MKADTLTLTHTNAGHGAGLVDVLVYLARTPMIETKIKVYQGIQKHNMGRLYTAVEITFLSPRVGPEMQFIENKILDFTHPDKEWSSWTTRSVLNAMFDKNQVEPAQ